MRDSAVSALVRRDEDRSCRVVADARPPHPDAARETAGEHVSRLAGVSVVNLSVLKNNRARAIRFSTLTVLCRALDCTPGELFTVVEGAPTPS
jgi:putative transcriptional regulator